MLRLTANSHSCIDKPKGLCIGYKQTLHADCMYNMDNYYAVYQYTNSHVLSRTTLCLQIEHAGVEQLPEGPATYRYHLRQHQRLRGDGGGEAGQCRATVDEDSLLLLRAPADMSRYIPLPDAHL